MNTSATGNPSSGTRNILDPRKLAPAVAREAAEFHRDVVRAVEQAVETQPVVVVGMAQNVFVKKTRSALEAAGIQFTYLEYGSYFSKWKQRLAIKLWTGWPTFPQVFVRGVLIGGHALTTAAIADGSLQRMLAAPAQDAQSVQA